MKAASGLRDMSVHSATVTKSRECPACGAVNRVRYEVSEMMIESACSSCGAMVRWKRKTPGAGGGIRTAFEDEGAELAPLDHYGRDGEV